MMNPLLLLMVGLPLVALAFSGGRPKPEWDTEDYMSLYRMEDPDRYTPGQRQFNPGFLVMTPGAESVFQRAEDAVSQVTGRDVSGMLMGQLYTHHSEGDWGDMEKKDPDWAAEQDKQMETGGLPQWGVTGIHNIAGTEVWVKTVPDGERNITTFYLPSED
jgi:hypothetical protein